MAHTESSQAVAYDIKDDKDACSVLVIKDVDILERSKLVSKGGEKGVCTKLLLM